MTSPWERDSARAGGPMPPAPGHGNGEDRAERLAVDAGKPIGVLFREVIDRTRALLREELRLAKAELREQAALAGRNLAWIAMGGGLALAAILVLCLALDRGLVVLLSRYIDSEIATWLVPLLLGLALLGVGGALIGKGVATLRDHLYLVPEKTKQSLKEDKEWLRQKVT
jgi:hypothetical protein